MLYNFNVRSLFFIIFLSSSLLANNASWTVFLYAESDASLNDAVFKNIYDLMRAQSSERVNIAVQLHCWDTTAWRFVVKDHALHSDGECMLSLNPSQDLIDGVRWAFKKFPADHYMLIFGSHGFGILDPVWSDDANDWITEIPEDMSASCPFKGGSGFTQSFEQVRSVHRGVLFYPPNIAHAYMTNQNMVDALRVITKDILGGNKIDILGMDACRMAMLEVAYQVAPYANYLIGTQDCELKDGWDYYAVANFLVDGNDNPRDVAVAEVFAYDTYYHASAPKGFYTQSAIDLEYVRAIADNLDAIIACVFKNLQQGSELREMMRLARKQQPLFCEMSSYVDLVHFYSVLKNGLEIGGIAGCTDLIVLLNEGIRLVQQAVVANVTGAKSSHAHGISLYFPRVYKQSSYAQCSFARATTWCTMLEALFSEMALQLNF